MIEKESERYRWISMFRVGFIYFTWCMRKTLFVKIATILPLMLFTLISFSVNAASSSEKVNWNEYCNANLTCEAVPLDVPYCVYNDSIDFVPDCVLTWETHLVSPKDEDLTTESILKRYCKALLWPSKRDWRIYFAKPSLVKWYTWWDWQQTFDSHQSLFLYALCSSFEWEDWGRPFLNSWMYLSGAFQWDVANILKLKQKAWKNDQCSIKDSNWLNHCDMSIYATEIFSAIMSEVFKIKYSEVFQVDTIENFDTKEKERVEAFMSWYFFITDGYKAIQSRFPQTVDVIVSNQKFYKKILEKLRLINNEEFIKRKVNCWTTWNIVWLDFIACALHWSHWKWTALDRAFVTMYYNEIFNYRMFISYYQQMLLKKIEKSDGLKDTDKRVIEAQYSDLWKYSNIQLSAAKKTLQDFTDLSMTYPLHIWFLMYQERMKNFRDRYLSPIVTLFYSLSEKLQNVQIPNEG